MTIRRGDQSPQPSRAQNAPATAPRESHKSSCRGRLLSLATLASSGALGLIATPAMAADPAPSVSLTYAPLVGVQAVDDAAAQPAAPPALAVETPAAATPPAAAVDAAAPAVTAPTIAPDATTPVTTPPAAAPAEGATPSARHDDHDIVVSARNKAPPGDPLIGINLKSYAVVQAADKALVGPAAMAYKKHLPSPLRQGIHNVLLNLREPPVIAAYLVEHKVGKAFETLGRVLINTTLGVGGIFDIAKRKPFHLPWHANGMADAMGFYGIKQGPYFFLPLIGPTTLRDLIGTTIDRVGFPALYADELRSPAFGLSVTILGGLDDRVSIDPQVREFREHAPDPYAAMKAFYLARRQAEIDALHGKPPLKDKLSDYDIPGSPPAATEVTPEAVATPAPVITAPPPAAAPTPDATPAPAPSPPATPVT